MAKKTSCNTRDFLRVKHIINPAKGGTHGLKLTKYNI